MSDNLSLLWTLRADNAQAKTAIAETQEATRSLSSTFGTELVNMQRISQAAFGSISADISGFAKEVPILGNVLAAVSKTLLGDVSKGLSATSAGISDVESAAPKAAKEISAFESIVAKLAKSTGQTTDEIKNVVTAFGSAETATKQVGIATAAFGGVLGLELVPELEAAATASTAVSAAEDEVAVSAVAAEVALSPLIITIGAVAVAATALVVGLAAAGYEAFKLGKEAADYGDEIYKAGVKTGNSAQFLSVAKVAVAELDGNFKTFTQGLARTEIALSKSLSNPSAEASKALNVLGLSARDLKDSLPDDRILAVGKALSNLTDVSERNRAAQALLSKAGIEQLATIEALSLHYDDLYKKTESLGLLWTGDMAVSAHNFNVQLTDLDLKFKGMAITIGEQVLPSLSRTIALLDGMTASSGGLAKTIGNVLTKEIDGFNLALRNAIPLLTAMIGLATGNTALFTGGIANMGTNLPQPTTGGDISVHGDNDTEFAGKTKKSKAESEQTELDRRLSIIKDGEDKIKTAYEKAKGDEQKTFDERLENLQDFTAKEILLAKIRLEGLQANAAAEKLIITESGIAADLKEKKLADVEKVMAKNQEDFDKTKNALEKTQRDKEEAAQIAHDEAMLALDEKRNAGLIASAKAFADEGYITFEEAEQRRQALEAASLANRLQFLKDEQAKWLENTEQFKAFTDKINELRQQDTNNAAENLRRLDDARKKDVESEKKHDKELEDARAALAQKLANDALARQLKNPLSVTNLFGANFEKLLQTARAAIGLLGNSLQNLGADFKAVAQAAAQFFAQQSAAAGNFGTIVGSAFTSVTNAIGQTLQALILTGTTGPAFLRKMTAEVLAQIAVQSATKAIFELAEGFADLFINPPAAAAHFTSAALYGSIALGSAVAGRVVAGNSFNQTSASTGGGGSGRGSSSPASSTQSNPTITQNRNQSPVQIVLHVESNDSHIVKAVVANAKNNGDVRDLILNLTGG